MESNKGIAKPSPKAAVRNKRDSFFSFGSDTAVAAPFFQAKLSINTPGDAFEQQADAVAEQVVNTSLPPVTSLSVANPSTVQRDDNGPREEEQDPLTGGLGVLGENLMENNPLFSPFLDRLKLRLWDSQPGELRNSIIGFGVADALILGTVFALDPHFRGQAINALDGVNLMTPLHLIPNSEFFTPSSFNYHLPQAGHPSYEFNGEFDLTPYFDFLHEHNGSFPQISPRFGLNLDYNPATQSLRVVGGTFNLDLFNRAISLQGGVNQFFTPDPTTFMPNDPFAMPVTSMLTLPSEQIRDTRFSITIDVPRLVNVIRGVPDTEVHRKVAGPVTDTIQRATVNEQEREEEIQRKPVTEDEEVVQRKTAVSENMEVAGETSATGLISRKATPSSATSDPMQSVSQALSGSGSNMDEDTQQFMEQRFQADFDNVKIHDDSTAHQSSAEINALAYTHKNHVVFGAGQYNPSSAEGKKLLAHELTHVVQQSAAGSSSSIQRRVVRGTADSPFDLIPLYSTATTLAGFAEDGISVVRDDQISLYKSIIVFTQTGLNIYVISTRRFTDHFGKRPGESWPSESIWDMGTDGGVSQVGIRDGHTVVESRRMDTTGFSAERQEIIRQRPGISFLEDMTLTTADELNRRNYLPAIVVVGTLPATGTGEGTGGTGTHVEDWASDQTRDLSQRLGLGSGSGSSSASGGDSTHAPDTPPSQRDTAADARRPDRIVVWAREDGRQFINVWVGGRNSADGGVAEAVELHEGESAEALQARVEQATERARTELTERANNAENQLTGGGVPYNEWTYSGGTGTGETPNRSSYRATMAGPEVMVRDGTGAYSMSLHYEDVYPDLLGQVSAAFNGSDYIWQIIDITALYQRVMAERGAAVETARQAILRGETPTAAGPGEAETELTTTERTTPTSAMHTVGRFEADMRDYERRDRNFTEDIEQSWNDLTHPLASQDGSAESAVRSVLVNSFNLASIPLHAITSLGGWLVRAFSSVFNTDPAYEKEIPFPNRDGYYLVRCVAQPRTIGEGENAIRRMPSVAVKVVEVKEIQARTSEELTSQGQNLEASILELLMSYRLAGDDAQRRQIRAVLEVKVQEAAQTHRSFLQEEKTNREADLGRRVHAREESGVTDPEPVEDRIREEIEILGHGTEEGSGLISAIIARQIAIKESELAAIPEWDTFRAREVRNQLAQLRSRLTTAREREAEMQGGGQPIVRPEAVFVNEEDGRTIPVLIEIGQVGERSTSRGYTMRLSDITGTSSDEHDSIGRTKADAVRHSIAEYAGHFPYGRGYLTVRFPSSDASLNFGITAPITVRCNPRDTAQASERLDELLQVLAVVGLFIPGVGVAVAAVGAAVSAGRILHRLNNHTFAWDTNTVMDVLNIVGAVAGGVRHITGGRLVVAQRMFAIVPESEEFAAWFNRLSRFDRVLRFVDSSVNNVSYFIGAVETVNNYLDIQRQEMSGAITHADARRQRASLMAQAMYDNFMQHGAGMVESFTGEGSAVHHEGDPPPHDTPPPPHETRPPHEGGTGGEPHHEDGTPRPHEETPRREGGGGGGEGPRRPRPEYTGTPAERVRQFLANRDNVHALLRGEPAIFGELLNVHGNWRDLIMMLQGEPHNPTYEYLVGELQTYRDGIRGELARRFGLELSDPNASTHASSDIDLATTGSDAGSRMTAAERYMREHYGPNWSEQLRMNFYTEAERLFMYEQTRSNMSEAAFGELQNRLTNLAEILNFAKMLQHAEGNPDSVRRVEELMGHLSADQLAEVRRRTAETPADAQARAAQLHSDIDNLAGRFEALRRMTGSAIPDIARSPLPETLPAHIREAIGRAVTADELRVAIASAISELQMEANFRTTEAYISPGAGRQAVRGVAVHGHEAYQSALGNLEMMEHFIHQSGGDVERAAREYELYKYINRFIIAMQLAGVPLNSFTLMYYQAAHDLYRNAAERTSLQGVGSHDMGYLMAMHNQFMAEAREALPRMREAAMANPAEWNATPRSLEASRTGIADTSPRTTTPSGGGGGTGGAAATSHLGTVGSLLGGGRGMVAIADVPVRRNTSLEGNETRATFVNGRLILELGPHAGHEQLRQHLDTLRVLQRYEGTLGVIRTLFSRIGELLGMGPGVGRRGHEARLEVTKLLDIRADLETRRRNIEDAMTSVSDQGTLDILSNNYERLLNEINSIESQVRDHESEVNSTAAGRGHVAMASTTPTGAVMTESNPEFRHEPAVGESRRYRDRGGTEGIVSRLADSVVAIVTRLGQTTVRADYQSWVTPAQVGLPSGRHGFEALHAIGPGVGHESPYGIYFGPWRVNQLIQRVGIERFIGDVGSHLRSGREVLLRVEVEKVTMPVTQPNGTVMQVDFLKSITYQLYGGSIGVGNKLFELNIEVARPNDPVSDVHFDPGSVFLSPSINTYTDMSHVSASFEPEFSATDPIDE